MGMTPQQVIDTVRAQFYEDSAKFVSDLELRTYMWQAELLLASLLECSETIDNATTTVAGTQQYLKPNDASHILRVEWDGVKLKKIDITDQDAIDGGGYGASLSQANPTSYYEFGDYVWLYPVPSSAEALTFFYIREPELPEATDTTFDVPAFVSKYIPDYVLYRMYAKDQDNGRAGFHQQLWEQGLDRAKGEWARIKRRDMHSVVRNEDYYPSTDLGII